MDKYFLFDVREQTLDERANGQHAAPVNRLFADRLVLLRFSFSLATVRQRQRFGNDSRVSLYFRSNFLREHFEIAL